MASPGTSTWDQTKIAQANEYLKDATPQEILAFAIDHVDGLIQTTAFGLTGLVAIDMISKISKSRGVPHSVPLIFLDTLYNFQETLDLAERVKQRYNPPYYVFTPQGARTTQEFEDKYGKELWKTDEDSYDYLVKVEPSRRAYEELDAKAAITGRRRSQGADRAALEPLEMDSTGFVKVNPLCRWGFEEVQNYIRENSVPYNALVDRGYKSIGDWHSTSIPKEGEGERAGRWADKKEKTECGLHQDYFKMKRLYEKRRLEEAHAAADEARGGAEVSK